MTDEAQRPPPAGPPRPGPQLLQRLGPYATTAVVVGSMIGSGIFKKPAVMAEHLRSPGLLLLTWALAGVITCFGALANAEVASLFPEAGGQYAYFKNIYNRFCGFLYGWAVFAVIQSGSIASIAYVFAEYTGYFVPLPRLSPGLEAFSLHLFGPVTVTPLSHLGLKLLTVATIAALTLVNVRGVALGGAVTSVFTTIKVAAVAALVLLAFSVGQGSTQHFSDAGGAMAPPPSGLWAMGAAMGLALSGAFWSYDGWNNVTFLAGEVRRPERTLPRSLATGTAAVVAIYVLVNLAYLYVLPLHQMAGARLVAADAMARVLGAPGASLLSGLVILSTFGATNGSILSSARVAYAMSRDGLFFSPLGRVHPRHHTPHVALWVQAAWASLLVFSGSFDQLTDMLIFVAWVFYAAGAAGVIVLRWRRPDLPRPFSVPGYPVVPLVFVAFAGAFVVATAAQNPRDVLLGLGLVGLGLPLYGYRLRRAARGA